MKTLAQALQQASLEEPEKIAITLIGREPEASQAITYRELFGEAARLAHRLEQSGVQPGEVVVLILDHGPDLIYAFFGAVLHGAVPAIMAFLTEKLSPEHYRSALKALFEVSRPAAAVTNGMFAPEVQQASLGSSLRATLVTGEPAPDASDPGEPDAATLHGLRRSPQDIALLQHSSGTTGLQKGVALSHQAVFNQLENYTLALRLQPDDVIVSWLPLYHDMGLIAGFLLPVLCRVPLVLMSPFHWVRAPYRLLQAVSQYRGTLTWLPNFAYNFCAQKIRDRDLVGVDLSSWRAVINCSEPMHWKSHQMFLERFRPYGLKPEALATCYAMAENVFAVSQGGVSAPVTIDRVSQSGLLERQQAEPVGDGEDGIPMVSAGPPVANTRVRVFNTQGQDLPERHIGELAIQSDCLLTGYFHRPDLTEKAFLDGWYLTGDLGYIAAGEVYVTGRKKDLIIVGGKNIYPQDLERMVSEVEGVHPGRVAAFGVFNENTGTEDVVVVAETDLAEGEDWEQKCNELAERIRERVTRGSDVALRTVKVVGRNWLLKTSSGKVARAANKEKYLKQGQDED